MKNFEDISAFVLVWFLIAVTPAVAIAVTFYCLGVNEGERKILAQERGFVCEKVEMNAEQSNDQ